LLKYGNVDNDDIRAKLDAIKQEPRERVQRYFECLDRLFGEAKLLMLNNGEDFWPN